MVDQGYDQLDCLAVINEKEIEEMVALFRTGESRKNIRFLVEALRKVGAEGYRKKRREFCLVLDEVMFFFATEYVLNIKKLSPVPRFKSLSDR